MTRLSKTDLVEQVENLPYSLSKSAAKVVVETILNRIADEVAAGNEVAIKGFGTFEPRHRAARLGRNPRTGGEVHIPASTVMGFRPSKTKAQD